MHVLKIIEAPILKLLSIPIFVPVRARVKLTRKPPRIAILEHKGDRSVFKEGSISKLMLTIPARLERETGGEL